MASLAMREANDGSADAVDTHVDARDVRLELHGAPPDRVDAVEVLVGELAHDRADTARRLEDDATVLVGGTPAPSSGSLVITVSGTSNPWRRMICAWYGFDPFDACEEGRLTTRAGVSPNQSVNVVVKGSTQQAL